MGASKYLLAIGTCVFAIACFVFRDQSPFNLILAPVMPYVTGFASMVTPYLQNPILIVTQLQQHALGYGIMVGVGSTITGGILNLIYKRGKTTFSNLLAQKEEEVSGYVSQITLLNQEKQTLTDEVRRALDLGGQQAGLLQDKIADLEGKLDIKDKQIETIIQERNMLQRVVAQPAYEQLEAERKEKEVP